MSYSSSFNRKYHVVRPVKKRDMRLTPFTHFFKLLLVTSLYVRLNQRYGEPDDALLKEINDKFNIVTRKDALWIPALLSGFLWRSYDPCKARSALKEDVYSKVEAIREIYLAIPQIGRYNGVSRDIERVLSDSLEAN